MLAESWRVVLSAGGCVAADSGRVLRILRLPPTLPIICLDIIAQDNPPMDHHLLIYIKF